jgi:hypothetical protein
VYTLHLDPYCVQESDGLSLIHVPGVGFDTLYNMNAGVGDRWNLSPLPEQCDSTSYLEVVDTGLAAIDGMQLRWMAVDIHFPELNWVFQDTIIERIGTMVSYFLRRTFASLPWTDRKAAPCGVFMMHRSTFKRNGRKSVKFL